MRKTRKVEIPAHTEERTDKIECDLCGAECQEQKIGHYDVVEISRECGDNWPEGGSATVTEYDICPACFEKLAAWLESQGATHRTREVEF